MPEVESVRVRATVRGRVQMVGFRAFAVEHAQSLNLGGTVSNRPDGSLECVAEGSRTEVDRLLELLRTGPRGARVDTVEVEEEAPRGGLGGMRVTA